jgi:salicylate hydroxylase
MYEQLGLVDKAIPTGDAAFRASILIDKITDPELRAFVSEHVGTRWMGPERHIQGYPIRHNGIYNMVSNFVFPSWLFLTKLEGALPP